MFSAYMLEQGMNCICATELFHLVQRRKSFTGLGHVPIESLTGMG